MGYSFNEKMARTTFDDERLVPRRTAWSETTRGRDESDKLAATWRAIGYGRIASSVECSMVCGGRRQETSWETGGASGSALESGTSKRLAPSISVAD